MAGEWIAPKARGIYAKFFPGEWEDKGGDMLEGRCPGEEAHSHGSARTDARIFLAYGPQGQPPGVYCLHNSCKGRLESLNEDFRAALFSRDDADGFRPGGRAVEEGVVVRPPRAREAWVPDFNLGKLKGVVFPAPVVDERFFAERSPVDVRGVTPAAFIEAVYKPGQRVLVFTDFKSQGDYLWQVGKGGYRLSDQAGVKAVRSKLPTDGGKDGVWFLNQPVDGGWHGNPRRAGKPSRRSQEAVTEWRYLVLECDEEKTLHKKAEILRAAAKEQDPLAWMLENKVDPKWAASMMPHRAVWSGIAKKMDEDAPTIPGLWMRLLAMCGLPIAAIYSSGGVSLHALVREDVGGFAEFSEKVREYKRRLPLLGADPAALTPVRLTRLPGCTRGGRMQKLIYLNPKAEAVPVTAMPKLRSV